MRRANVVLAMSIVAALLGILGPVATASGQTCANGTYVNTAGNTVCRPFPASTPPAGATAQCNDGQYSMSQNRSGTCSGHGGVLEFLTPAATATALVPVTGGAAATVPPTTVAVAPCGAATCIISIAPAPAAPVAQPAVAAPVLLTLTG